MSKRNAPLASSLVSLLLLSACGGTTLVHSGGGADGADGSPPIGASPEGGIGQPCLAQADCALGLVCAYGACTLPAGIPVGTSPDGGSGEPCNAQADCAPGLICAYGHCAPTATCNDGMQNGDETDVDCGGYVCSSCLPGQRCVHSTDCTAGVCSNGICQAPTCYDGVKNGNETDLDCGGACAPCPIGKQCLVSADCVNYAVCTNGICQDPCPLCR
jgi:hypothetical protein